MAGNYFSPEEVSKKLGLSIDEINQLVDRKELFPIRDGTARKFKVDVLDRYISKRSESNVTNLEELDLDLIVPTIDSIKATASTKDESRSTQFDIPDQSDFELNSSIKTSSSNDLSAAIEIDDAIKRADSIHSSADDEKLSISDTNVGKNGSAVQGLSSSDLLLNSNASKNILEDDLEIESIISASSPSMIGGEHKSGLALSGIELGDENGGTLSIDLSGSGPSVKGGSALSLDPISDRGAGKSGLSLSGALDSGLSLEGDDGSVEISGVDLGKVGDSIAFDDGTQLGGDEFDLGGTPEDESASVVIATDSSQATGDASFFGQTMAGEGSSFESEAGLVSDTDGGSLGTMTGASYPSGEAISETPFSGWQIAGLTFCAMLMLVGGFMAFDLIRTIGSTQGPSFSNPLLNAMAETFGWR